jgi:uncharacterized membrane protein YfcA
MAAKSFTGAMIIFVMGVALFILGAYLVKDIIFKFLKFAVGLFLIFLAIPMMLGSVGWLRFGRRGRVVRIHRPGP